MESRQPLFSSPLHHCYCRKPQLANEEARETRAILTNEQPYNEAPGTVRGSLITSSFQLVASFQPPHNSDLSRQFSIRLPL